MDGQRRIADYGVSIGRMPKGPRNRITDVPGVRVGHATLDDARRKTGVTVIVPCADNPFYDKLVAAAYVLNGFGKSLGLMQVEELGMLETPIALTGTLNVGLVHDALVGETLVRCAAEGRALPTSINPVVCECNDGRLSDSALRPVRAEHVREALARAGEEFAEGSVGAGRGMICHGLKGGIGSASRVIELGAERYTLGLLALTNHGKLEDLMIAGQLVGPQFAREIAAMAGAETEEAPERGSVIVVIATDLPVDARQLYRILRRAPVGLARLGAYIGHGSGEVVVGFTTANRVPHEGGPAVRMQRVLHEELLDDAFRAAAECCEEAVLNSLVCAETTIGCNGDAVYSIKNVLVQDKILGFADLR